MDEVLTTASNIPHDRLIDIDVPDFYNKYVSAKSSLHKTVERYQYLEQPQQEHKYSWEDEYSQINKSSLKPTKRKFSVKSFSPKEFYSIEECLKAYEELSKKDFNEIYLTGAVALWLQHKITRSEFRDLDVIVVGDYELDDDLQDYKNGDRYVKNDKLAECRSLVYNNIPVDLFKYESDKLNIVNIDFNGKTFFCQDYRDIILAKFNMILPRMKDSDELFGNCFDLQFK